MNNVSNGGGTDQAAGLRDIFGSELCHIICIASTLDHDSTINLGHGTAHSIKQHGHKVLLVDEVALADRKTMSGFLYPVRYDLGQVFTNSVDLPRGINQIEENFWYATGAKLRSEIGNRFAKYPPLDQRMLAYEFHIDYLIYPTVDPQANVLAFYGSNIKRILVTSIDQISLQKAMVMIRQLASLQLDEVFSVLMVGGEDEAAGAAAIEKLHEAALSALEQPLEFMGWIRAFTAERVELDIDDMSFNPVSKGVKQEFVLPQGFFKAISAKITA